MLLVDNQADVTQKRTPPVHRPRISAMAFPTAPGMSVISFRKEAGVQHRCRICPKTFKRSEHRNRHERGRWVDLSEKSGVSAKDK